MLGHNTESKNGAHVNVVHWITREVCEEMELVSGSTDADLIVWKVNIEKRIVWVWFAVFIMISLKNKC